MTTSQVRVEAQSLEQDGTISVRLGAIAGASIQPGQMVVAHRPGFDWHCHALIPIRIADAGFSALLPEGALWPPGSTLVVRGPIGDGFQPPASSRRWLLISFGRSAPFLRPLIDMGLAQNREVAFVSDDDTSSLPPAVEILSQPEEGLGWADYVAVGTPSHRLNELIHQLTGSAWRSHGLADEVLAVGPTPCGIGGCQACTLEGRDRRHLLCVDGAVVRLGDLRD